MWRKVGLCIGLAGCFLLTSCGAIGEGISAESLLGALDYFLFEGLSADQIWTRIDQAEYWAIPLEPPAKYYESVQTSSAATLRSMLHVLIDEHVVYHYSTSDTPDNEDFEVDVWDIVALADAHPELPSYVLDLYLNATFKRQDKGVTFAQHYDREHSWPKSLGFSNESSPAYTDCHHLFAAYSRYNSSRGNKPFGVSSTAQGTCKPTVKNLGRGGASVCNVRHSQTWEVWEGRRGDVARAMFYMATRYEGDVAKEPDLELTDNPDDIKTSTAWKIQGEAFMGMLSVLLEWHREDPVDDLERRRNSIIYLFQSNRNPFTDHPEWVEVIFGQ